MLLNQFKFDLPRDLIATNPISPRDRARMLVCADEFVDLTVRNIVDFLDPGDVIIFNDTKVVPARLEGYISDNNNYTNQKSNVQITLHKQVNAKTWKAFAKPAKKFKLGCFFHICEGMYAKIMNKHEGEITLEFNLEGDKFFILLDQYGYMPLPPYIERKDKLANDSDNVNYQTIYAKHQGAVAAPTAGLHFTEELLDSINKKDIKCKFVTLHVGAGTFLPVRAENIEDHKMHSEYGIVTKDVADTVNEAKKEGNKIISVGTTSLRLLESAACNDGLLKSFCGDTDIFITPGYKFKIVDRLLTNFHLPESTLFMLVCAFAGMNKMQDAYSHAIANKYRFYSYGDACLLSLSEEKNR